MKILARPKKQRLRLGMGPTSEAFAVHTVELLTCHESGRANILHRGQP